MLELVLETPGDFISLLAASTLILIQHLRSTLKSQFRRNGSSTWNGSWKP